MTPGTSDQDGTWLARWMVSIQTPREMPEPGQCLAGLGSTAGTLMARKEKSMSTGRLHLMVLIAAAILMPPWLASDAEEGVMPKPDAVPLSGSSVQSLLGPEMLISWDPTMPETDRYVPDVAFNYVRGEYLVVWHNLWPATGHRDIYARRVAQDGRLLSWFAVSDLPNSCLQPAVAYDAANAQYLVVWMYDAAGDGSQYEIWGRIIEWNAPGTSRSFKIMSWANRSFWSPRVVWNHNRGHYFVVWNAFDTGTGLPNDIAGKRVYAGGTTDASATILTTSTQPHQVDLAYNWSTDEWFITFVRSYSTVPPATSNDIYGQRISYGNVGQLVPGSVVYPINTELNHQDAPAVTVDGQGELMVIFEHEYTAADRDIYAQKLDANGNKIGGKIPIRNSALNETSPDVVASFDATPEYIAVWQEETTTGQAVRIRRWGPGLPLEYVTVSDFDFWESAAPAVAGGRPSYLIAYEGDSTADPTVIRHIYGHRFAGNVVLLPLIQRNSN
jgi:hypothetical protein